MRNIHRGYRDASHKRRSFNIFSRNVIDAGILEFGDHLFDDFSEQLPAGQKVLGVLVILGII